MADETLLEVLVTDVPAEARRGPRVETADEQRVRAMYYEYTLALQRPELRYDRAGRPSPAVFGFDKTNRSPAERVGERVRSLAEDAVKARKSGNTLLADRYVQQARLEIEGYQVRKANGGSREHERLRRSMSHRIERIRAMDRESMQVRDRLVEQSAEQRMPTPEAKKKLRIATERRPTDSRKPELSEAYERAAETAARAEYARELNFRTPEELERDRKHCATYARGIREDRRLARNAKAIGVAQYSYNEPPGGYPLALDNEKTFLLRQADLYATADRLKDTPLGDRYKLQADFNQAWVDHKSAPRDQQSREQLNKLAAAIQQSDARMLAQVQMREQGLDPKQVREFAESQGRRFDVSLAAERGMAADDARRREIRRQAVSELAAKSQVEAEQEPRVEKQAEKAREADTAPAGRVLESVGRHDTPLRAMQIPGHVAEVADDYIAYVRESDNKRAIVDRGRRIEVETDDADTRKLALQHAAERYPRGFTISGDQQEQQQMIRSAAEMNLAHRIRNPELRSIVEREIEAHEATLMPHERAERQAARKEDQQRMAEADQQAAKKREQEQQQAQSM
jgi:hypothetical protein